jgi:hypothetical protein
MVRNKWRAVLIATVLLHSASCQTYLEESTEDHFEAYRHLMKCDEQTAKRFASCDEYQTIMKALYEQAMDRCRDRIAEGMATLPSDRGEALMWRCGTNWIEGELIERTMWLMIDRSKKSS